MRVAAPSPRWQSLIERVRQSGAQLFAPGDFPALFMLIALLWIPALSLTASEWPLELRIVLPVMALSAIFGFLLARSQYSELLALMMSAVYGLSFVLLISAWTATGNIASGMLEVFTRTVIWGYDAVNGGVNQDTLVFTMLVAWMFWYLGYNAAWHVYRYDRVFRVITPPAIILLTNAVYYSGDANLLLYIVLFAFVSLLLMVRSSFEERLYLWYRSRMRVPQNIRTQFNAAGAILAVLVVMTAYMIPTNNLQNRLDAFQEFMQNQTLQDWGEVWNRLFSTIEAYGPVTADYYGGDTLQLSGAIQLGDQVVMQVEAPPGRRYYWRSRIFDTYQDGGWRSQAEKRITYPTSPFTVGPESLAPAGRERVSQTYTVALNAASILYAAPQMESVNMPVKADLRFLDEAETQMNVYVARPLRVQERGDQYTVTSLMSSATAEQLRAASTDYPQWVRDTQLYVPPSVTGRTIDLAAQIIANAGAVTPYDKAKAIESWLRANIVYNETIPQPPVGQDPIDWVLFDHREGYCNYYASSMAMMLRSQGIPARMGAGFAQGEWNGSAYVVRERDAHTWVEVYFPGYGWIEFEPTSAQEPVDRGDDQPALPTPEPVMTSTPTPSPSPTPTLTATPSPEGTPPAPENEALQLPTTTPTASPTPTATPVIIPTSEPPLQPRVQGGPLSFLLPALLLGLLGILLIVVLVVIGFAVWWWWEWRGLRGMSPIARAYARLERYVSGLLGVELLPQETTLERRQRIRQVLPRKSDNAVRYITQSYTQERYGRGPEHPNEVEQHERGAEQAWQNAREGILSRWARRFNPFSRWMQDDD